MGVMQIEALQLTIHPLGKDTIRLCWNELPGDSLYSVYDSPDSLGSFQFLMQTDTCAVTIPLEELREGYFQVRRVL